MRLRQGEFMEAPKFMLKGHELGSQHPGWPYPSAAWVAECQQLAILDARATAILRGQANPANAREQVVLADVCQRKKSYAAAVRFYAGAFSGAPGLADDIAKGWRHQGARAAALAASGQRRDASQVDGAARASLRHQARNWLQADLKQLTGMVPVGPAWEPEARAADPGQVLLTLDRSSQWLTEADWAGLREKVELAGLPHDAQQAWRQFWTDVRQLQQQAAGHFRETRLSGRPTGQKLTQAHEITPQAGKNYVLDLQSKQFNTVVRLEDAQGKKLAEEGPGIGGIAHIDFTAAEAGTYRVLATSLLQAGTGDYTPLLREFTPQAR
jgi:hypothetical protein